ncbi:restriction endonuclease subunit S [Acinetobacter indicus]|uniref:restriction endonuclease subunit S n=1 Tax=Acinetobacter indicus TaxID=756892 RepID=UPI002578C22C|nr:restriction endonuclease subunit S [Acinetobacter indicus]MDM1311296.1 restriction endonuclease subunit S [Acinetobacter indicus]
MEFKQYPSYKNSGVEWLGDVPEHWQVKPNKYVFKIQKRIAGTLGFNVLSITQKGLKIKDIESNAGQMAQDYSKYQIVNVGDFAMNHMDLLTGWVDIAKVTGVTSPDYRVFEVRNKKVNKEYFLHLFQLGYRNKILFAFGQGAAQMGRWRLQSETFNSLKMPFPSIEEQEKIVSFLDTETARIDTLIAKQEKLIELLEEQHKSIISHAVTKGLNPNAPMKDSGVEWLGQVPEHWMTPSSKHLLEIPITDGPHETPNFVDDGIPFISAEAISKGKIDFDKKRGYITPELNAIYSKKYSPKVEDIYMVKSGATTGKVAMVETTETFNIWSPLAVFRCNKNKVLPKFLLAVFNSSHFYDALVLNWSYGTQQNIGMGVLSNIEIPCPPLKEQAEIIQHLDVLNTKFDKLIGTQSQLIEKLKEYRSSIISHAVTGKIDVREFY